MKNVLLLIASLSYLISFGQTLDSIWYHTYEYNSWDEIPSTIVEAFDGGYLIAGTVGYPAKDEDDFDAYLLKIDKDGNKLWSKTYGVWDIGDGITYLQKTSDNQYIASGHTSRPYSGEDQAWLLKISQTGDTIWTKTYQKSFSNSANYVTETNDGGFAIVGSYSGAGSGSKLYLIKTDNLGDTLWTRTFEKDLYNIGRCIKETNDNGLFIITQTFSIYPSNIWNIYIIKTDDVGDTLWTKYVVGEAFEYIADMIVDNDTIYLIGSSYYNNSSDVLAIKITTDGDIIWNKKFESDSSAGAFSARFAFDGNILIGGWSCEYNSYANVYLLKINEQGEFLWSKTFDSNYTQSVRSIALTSDNGYILTGETTTDYMRGDVFAMKVGYETTGFAYKGMFPNLKFKIYPNPTKQYTTIKIYLHEPSNVKISIFNLQGERISQLTEKLLPQGSHKFSLNCSTYSSGVYYCKLEAGNRNQVRKIIIAR